VLPSWSYHLVKQACEAKCRRESGYGEANLARASKRATGKRLGYRAIQCIHGFPFYANGATLCPACRKFGLQMLY
jgi:hypothetical protein